MMRWVFKISACAEPKTDTACNRRKAVKQEPV